MIVSFISGFVSVFVVTEQSEEEPPESEISIAVPVAVGSSTSMDNFDTGHFKRAEAEADFEEEVDRAPEVPPGRTPDGVMVTGVFYLKCFDGEGTLYTKDVCDELNILERRFSSRLYIVDKCARAFAGGSPRGLLSLGVNVDFTAKEIGFWAGPSSDLEGATQIGSCVRRELAGLPLNDINAKFARYRLFFSVNFDDPKKLARKIKKLRRRGRPVRVVKDHVRVRRAPEDGYAFGKLSSDTEVTLVERKDEWCRVVTPGDNEGWMICDALDV
jgi:hypothetical protein